MKKIVIIALFASVLIGVAAGSLLTKEGGIDSLPLIGESCTQEFQDLYATHKADLRDCSSSIREGTFEREAVAPKQNNVVLIFDASGSMAGMSGGEQKIVAAKAAVENFVAGLEDTNTNVSVVVYGHQGDNTEANQAASCRGIEELYSFGEASGSKISTTLQRFEPTGWTPIAAAITAAADILKPYASDEYVNSIVVITDGIETCGGDPVAVVDQMNRGELDIRINVIGFDVTESESQELRVISARTDGEYFDAASRRDIEFALDTHRAYMEEFDYRMKRVSETLEDVTTATEKHFACIRVLEEERANMILDIYVDEVVSPSCQVKVDELYSREYDLILLELQASFKNLVEKI